MIVEINLMIVSLVLNYLLLGYITHEKIDRRCWKGYENVMFIPAFILIWPVIWIIYCVGSFVGWIDFKS